MESLQSVLKEARETALVAWGAIHHFHRGEFTIHHKEDGPATDADRLADQVIVGRLEELYGREQYGYLSEEFEKDLDRLERERVWLIDPIDGTVDFIKGRDDFAVHIGMTEKQPDGTHSVVLGVVYHPRGRALYTAIKGHGAFVEKEPVPEDGSFWWERGENAYKDAFESPAPLKTTVSQATADLTAVVSKSHLTRRLRAFLAQTQLAGFYQHGSLGVKVMEVATGRADFYINTERGKCNEWDIGAPSIILQEAGGTVTSLDGDDILYNQPDVELPAGIIASNGNAHDVLLEAVNQVDILKPDL